MTARLTYANVVSSLALFIALGGSSYAAIELKRNSVRSVHIAKGQVKAPDIGANAVDSTRIKDGTLTRSDFAPGQVTPEPGQERAPAPAGPSGPAGPQGGPGPTGSRGGDGRDGADATRLWAAVTGEGTLVRSSGALSATKDDTGRYVVRFDRDVSQCSYQATPGSAFAYWNPTIVGPRMVEVEPAAELSGPSNTYPVRDSVRIASRNESGTLTTSSFHLAVFC
jgi:hypothetical protein